jgi:hypothetical protein
VPMPTNADALLALIGVYRSISAALKTAPNCQRGKTRAT